MSTAQCTASVKDEVLMEELNENEVDELHLCLVCCSKVQNERDDCYVDNNNGIVSSSLVVSYLVRKVLQVPDAQLEHGNNLISCGNPLELVRLCDKCTELTGQAEELYRKLKRIERELDCFEQLIWNKASASINCEADRKLVEKTIDLTKKSSQVWRSIRNHVANKSVRKGSCFVELEENIVEASSSPSSSCSTSIKNEVDPETETESVSEPFQSEDFATVECILKSEQEQEQLDQDDNDENGEKEEEDGHQDSTAYLEEMDQDKHEEEEDEEKEVDWNWEPDDQDEQDEEDEEDESELGEVEEEVDQEETLDPQDEMSEMKELKIEEEEVVVKPRAKNSVKGPPSSPHKRKRAANRGIGRRNPMLTTADGKLKCRHCDQTFLRESGRNSHEREKHPENPGAFVCDLCGKAFNSRCYLRKHTQRSHNSSRVLFKADGTPIKRYRKVIRTPDGKYQCRHSDCGQTFTSQEGCIAHEHEKHSKTPGAFICDVCGKAFNSEHYLRGHKLKTHKLKADGTPVPKKVGKEHMCEHCGKPFRERQELRKHVKHVHEKSFSINCALCGAGKRTWTGLKRHMFAIHPEDPATGKLVEEEGLGWWKCPVIGCSYGHGFLKEENLKAHLRSRHGKGEEEVEALDLGKGLVLEDPSLRATCQKCGKAFVNGGKLRKHEKMVHENEGKARDFICASCGAGFVCQAYLNTHLKSVHSSVGEDPQGNQLQFKCELCGKGYRYKYKLTLHLELHAKKERRRDYFCDKCAHGFVTEKDLKKHLRRSKCAGEQGEGAQAKTVDSSKVQ